jgi:hypothetical protein
MSDAPSSDRSRRLMTGARRPLVALLAIALGSTAPAGQTPHHSDLPHKIPVFCTDGMIVRARETLVLDH